VENNETPERTSVDDLHAGTSEIADAARDSIHQIDKDFDEKLNNIGDRVQSARQSADKFKPESNNASGMTPTEARGIGVGLTVAYSIIGTPLFMYGVGLLIDNATGTPATATLKWSSGLLLLGAIFGVGFAIYTTQKLNK
jgi:hypothetical protein